MREINASWLLSTNQKATRVTNAKDHLSHFNHKGDMFLDRIIIGDETGVHYAKPETNAKPKL